MRKNKTKRRSKPETIRRDEIDVVSATFEISSNQIKIPLHNLVKYSQFVQEEFFKKNEILSELNNKVQKVSIKHENSINTFLQFLSDKETQIKNEEFIDLLKLSEIFKVEQLKNVLKKYLQNHSKDVDLILSLKIEKENNKEEITILNDYVSEEMEECLKMNINECLENDKIKEISVLSIYHMIEKSSREQISNDLLCRFIIESIKERHILFKFVEIEKLSKEAFEELSEYYTTENNQTHYFDFLPNNFSYISKLILKQISLEKRIEEIEKTKDNITKEYRQKIEKMTKINEEQEKQIQELENIKKNIMDENKRKDEENKIIKKINKEQEKQIQELENVKKNIMDENKRKDKENRIIKKINKEQEKQIQELENIKKNIMDENKRKDKETKIQMVNKQLEEQNRKELKQEISFFVK